MGTSIPALQMGKPRPKGAQLESESQDPQEVWLQTHTPDGPNQVTGEMGLWMYFGGRGLLQFWISC